MPFEIILNSSGNLPPGGNVQGKVILVLENSVDIKGIQVKLRGVESTSWRTEEIHTDYLGSRSYKTVHCHGNNAFLKRQVFLAKEGTIGPGTLEYPFNFTLPNRLPSSFTTKHGKIRYYVRVLVEKPNAPRVPKEVDFFVVSPINLNTMPDLVMFPTQYQDENNLYRCDCFRQGSIVMNLYLDKEAYVLGETMKFKVQILNMSNANVTSLDVKLKMIIVEMTTVPNSANKYAESILAEIRDAGVSPHCDRTFDLFLTVPLTAVLPNFQSCSLFEMWSFLEVEAAVKGSHNSTLSTKITLGHTASGTGTEVSELLPKQAATLSDAGPPYGFNIGSGPHSKEPKIHGVHPHIPGNNLEIFNTNGKYEESSTPHPPSFTIPYSIIPFSTPTPPESTSNRTPGTSSTPYTSAASTVPYPPELFSSPTESLPPYPTGTPSTQSLETSSTPYQPSAPYHPDATQTS